MFPKQNTMSYYWFLMTIKWWRFTELPFLELELNPHRITSNMGENNINCIYLIVPRKVFPWFPLISCQSHLFDWCKMSQSKCLKEKPKEDINNTVSSKEARMDKLEKKIKKKKGLQLLFENLLTCFVTWLNALGEKFVWYEAAIFCHLQVNPSLTRDR